MTLRTFLVALSTTVVAFVAGCGGENGLTVRGSVEVDTGDATTGFNFPHDVRIDEVEASSVGRVTGLCEMRRVRGRDGEQTWGVVVEIHRGGVVDDRGLASLTIMQRSDAAPDGGRVEAELGTTHYASGAGGDCSVEMPYAVRDSGMVGLTAHCELRDASGETAAVQLELDLVGCTVAE